MSKYSALSLMLVLIAAGLTLASSEHERMLRDSCARLLPGASICFIWWCRELNVELAGQLMASTPNPPDIAQHVETASRSAVIAATGTSTANTDSENVMERSISDLFADESFSDKKTHNADFRSRPRPRPRKPQSQ